MRVSLVFTTLLCFTTWKSSIHAPNGAVMSCCLSTSNTQIRKEYIADYTVQIKHFCPINAIVFRTIREKTICSDPDRLWTKTTMAWVDSRKWSRTGGTIEEEGRKRLQRRQRFRTTTGGAICSDQNGDCAKEDVLKVDEEDRKNTLQENGQNNKGATSDITPATVTTSTYTMQRENRQNDEGATSDITPATATTSKLHLTEKPKVQWQNGPKTFCLRNHNTSHTYHSQQTLLFTVVLLLLYCINSKHM